MTAVSNERGLKRIWDQMNVVSNEQVSRSQMNAVSNEVVSNEWSQMDWSQLSAHHVCALHCVREVTSIRIAFEVFRRGHHAFRESSFVSLAHGPRWLFLLSRHSKAISAAANQKPFCK